MTDAPDTVTDALSLLASKGYRADVQLIDGSLRWRDAGASCAPDEAVVEEMFRFEGESDPGDEMVVFGVRDPVTGVRGAVASAYGPAGDPEVIDHVKVLASRYHEAS